MFGTVIAHSLFDAGTATSDCEKLEIHYNTWDSFILIVVLTAGLAKKKNDIQGCCHPLSDTGKCSSRLEEAVSAMSLCSSGYMAVIDDVGPYI
jgi:hypothetical protein